MRREIARGVIILDGGGGGGGPPARLIQIGTTIPPVLKALRNVSTAVNRAKLERG